MAGGNKFNGGELRGVPFLGSNSVSTALADNRIRQDSGTCRQKLTAWVGLLCCEVASKRTDRALWDSFISDSFTWGFRIPMKLQFSRMAPKMAASTKYGLEHGWKVYALYVYCIPQIEK